MFTGLCTAIVTPFSEGNVDYAAFERLLDLQIEGGVKSICTSGSTGEGATLSDEEYSKLISIAVKKSNGSLSIVPGVGGNNTKKVIENAKKAEDLGANAVLAIVPYYNKPNQSGIYKHFENLANSTKLPIIIYNAPGRTVTDISCDTVAELAKISNICGIKDSSGLLERSAILRAKLIEKSVALEKFKIYSGDDILSLGFIAMGACGMFSVASNIIPKECVEMVNFAMLGNFTKALELQDKYALLFDNIFCDTNPAPIKYCLAKMGLIQNELRLPLTSVEEKNAKLLDETLKSLSIIK